MSQNHMRDGVLQPDLLQQSNQPPALAQVAALELIPTAPFNFDATFHKPDHFTTSDNTWQPGTRWQTWRWRGDALGLAFRDVGTVDQPALRVDVYATHGPDAASLAALAAEIRTRYNLDLDLTPFYGAFESDPVLGPVQARLRGMRPGHPSTLYEYLIIGVVLQNATIRRSIQMFQALLDRFGTRVQFDGQVLDCFWSPGDLASAGEDDLRVLKVGYRARAIKRLDDQFAQGAVDEANLRVQDRDTQMKTLLQLYGVGPATVWYLLFDVFHHWDFFNHISPWEQKIYSKLFFDQDPDRPVPVEQLLAHFERYGVYKQLAVHYLWEDLWWKHVQEPISWFTPLIRR